MVANVDFSQFYNIKPADVTITVGGDNQLTCKKVGDLRVETVTGPLDLYGVRIVPGFGVNILSGPILEQKMGMKLSSDGKTWWARRRGRIVLQGTADEAGLYWVVLNLTARRKVNNVKGNQGQQPLADSGKSKKGVL